MNQITLINGPAWPETYEDLNALYQEYIRESANDPDAFTYSDLKEGRSYYFYGQKVLEFIPAKKEKASKLKIFEQSSDEDQPGVGKLKPVNQKTADLSVILAQLCELKRSIFRNTISETFGCCNDFMRCSDAGECIHPDDRFYNGCGYRRNLEAGKIFYGEKRNV